MSDDADKAIKAIVDDLAKRWGCDPATITVHVLRPPTQADWDALDPNSYEADCARCGGYVLGQFGPDKETTTPCPECGSTEYATGISSPAGAMSLALSTGF